MFIIYYFAPARTLHHQVAKHLTSVPVLVVKSNSVSRFAPPIGAGVSGFEPGQKEYLTVMTHLEYSSVRVISPCVIVFTEIDVPRD